MPGLLEGVRVLDCAWLLLDYQGQILANDGADVIHVEEPTMGDYMRSFLGQVAAGWSPNFLQRNIDKRSITLNLKTEEGRAVFYRLVETADVVYASYTTDALRRLAIDYDTLTEINPRIIYVQCTGYGTRGPYSSIPTHGAHFDAHTGMYRYSLDEHGLAEEEQAELSPLQRIAGLEASCLYGAIGIAAALFERHRTGTGHFFDLSAGDAGIATDWFSLVPSLNRDKVTPFAQPTPTSHLPKSALVGGWARLQFYAALDGRVLLADLVDDDRWARFCDASGRSDLLSYAGTDEQLTEELRQLFAIRTRLAWLDLARAHALSIGPVLANEELVTNANLRQRHLIDDMHHPVIGPWFVQGSPLRQDYKVTRPTPSLGEHTAELLTELGYSMQDYKDFKARGIV